MENTRKQAAKAAIGLLGACTAALLLLACPNDTGGSDNIAAGTRSVRTIKGVAVPLRYVPAGSFQRDGTAANVSVITKGYWLAETETTQELFQAVMGNNPSYFHGGTGREVAEGETQNKRPVENVNWYHAIAFCNKLSLADGKQMVYSVTKSGNEINWTSLTFANIPIADDSDWNAVTQDLSKNGYRLPTEMEWMWAAMGADKTVQPNTGGRNKDFAGSGGSNSIDNYAWYDNNSSDKTHEAGKKTGNELGLKDMSGNVWEWCWDWYGEDYPANEQSDCTGAAAGPNRVRRGGSWDFNASHCAVAVRDYGYPTDLYYTLGFRFACP